MKDRPVCEIQRMGRPVDSSLLLSAGYEPIKIISWKKAITLVFLGKVEVLEEYSTCVHSPTVSISLPSVVKLNRFVKPIPRRVKFSRQNVFSRDNYTCQYCRKRFPVNQLTYDHVVPRSRGGRTNWTNVVASCQKCNLRKGNKPLDTINFRLMKNPEEPRWMPQLGSIFGKESAPSSWNMYLSYGQKHS